jgi:hypothetical protein
LACEVGGHLSLYSSLSCSIAFSRPLTEDEIGSHPPCASREVR